MTAVVLVGLSASALLLVAFAPLRRVCGGAAAGSKGAASRQAAAAAGSGSREEITAAAGLRLEVSVRLCESQSSETARERRLCLRLDGELGIEELGLDGALYTSTTYWAFTWAGTWAACCVLRGAGWRRSGSGTRQPSPSPPSPTGTAFLPNIFSW